MSQESTGIMIRKTKYTVLSPFIGVGIALLLSELGLEVEMSVGYVLGLCIGLGIDIHKNDKLP